MPSVDRRCDAAGGGGIDAVDSVLLQRSCVAHAVVGVAVDSVDTVATIGGYRPYLFQFFPYLLPHYDDYDCFEDYSERYGCDEHRVNYGCEMFPLAAAAAVAGAAVDADAARGIDGVVVVAAVDAAAAGAEIGWCRWANCCTVAAHFGRFESYDFWTMDLNEMEAVMTMRMLLEHEMAYSAAAGGGGGYCIDDDYCCCCLAHEMASALLYHHYYYYRYYYS